MTVVFEVPIAELAISYLTGKLFGITVETPFVIFHEIIIKKTIKKEIEKSISEKEIDNSVKKIFDDTEGKYEVIKNGFYNQIFRLYQGVEECWYVTAFPCKSSKKDTIIEQLSKMISKIRDRLWNNKILNRFFKDTDFQTRLRAEVDEINRNIIDLNRRVAGVEEDVSEIRRDIKTINKKIGEIAPKQTVMESYSMPKRTFIGRSKDLSDIREALDKDNLVFVNGFGGIGKSELCREFVRRFKEKDGTKVVWLTYDNSVRNTVATKLRISNFDESRYGGDIDAIYEAKFNVLAGEKDILVILDNYGWGDDLSDFINHQSLKTIVTTRYKGIPDDYSVVSVGNLSEEEAFELLREYSGNRGEWISANHEALSELLRRIQYHTMTVILIGGLIKEKLIDVKSLTDNISDMSDEEIHLRKNDKDIYATISKHISLLMSSYNLSQEEIEVLSAASMIPVEGMESELFEVLSSVPSKALRRLSNINVLNKFEIDGIDYISMHPLLCEYIRERQPPSSTDDGSRFSKNYMVGFNEWMSDEMELASKKRLFAETFMLVPLEKIYAEEMKKRDYDPDTLSSFYYQSAIWYAGIGSLKESKGFCDILATMAEDQQSVKIKCMYHEALAWVNAVSGSFWEAACQYQSIQGYHNLGEYEGGLEMWEICYRIGEMFHLADDQEEALGYAQKASEYLGDSNAEAAEAIRLLISQIQSAMYYPIRVRDYGSKMLNSSEKVDTSSLEFDRDDLDGETRFLLGMLIRSRTDFEFHLKMCEAVADRLKDYPADDWILSVLGRLAEVTFQNRKDGRYLKIMKILLEKEKEMLPSDHMNFIYRYYAIGGEELVFGDNDASIDDFREALRIIEEKGLEGHFLKAPIYSNIGTALYMKGLKEESFDYCQKAIEVIERTPGRSALSLYAYDVAGLYHYEKGDYESARGYYIKSMVINGFDFSGAFGYPAYIHIYSAMVYCLLRKHDDALSILSGVATPDIESLPETPLKSYLYVLVGHLYALKGRYKEAIDSYKKSDMETVSNFIWQGAVMHSEKVMNGIEKESKTYVGGIERIARDIMRKGSW